MNALTLTQPAALTMSSLEIAELTSKRHDHVMRDIRVMLTELEGEGGLPKFGDTHINPQNNQTYPIFRLPKDLTLTLVAGYSVILRKRIIDRWLELETAASRPPAIPQTLPEALRLAADLADQKLALEQQVAEQAPKVQGFDRIANADGLLTLRETATTLKVPERKFIQWMQQHDWLYRRPDKGTLLGYAERIKQGFLEHKAITIHNTVTGQDEVREHVRVTPRGLSILAQRFGEVPEAA